jgi:hypothetical protein
MKYLYLIIGLCFCVQISAQSYMITTKADSLVGKIQIRENRAGNEFVRFKSGKIKETYEIFQIKKIIDKDGNKLVPINVEGKYRFGLVEMEGYLSKYLYTSPEGNLKFQSEVLIKVDGSTQIVPGAIGFRSTMAKFTSECPRVSQGLKNKEYSRNELAKIIADFNACINEKSMISTASETADLLPSTSLASQLQEFKKRLSVSTKVQNKEEAIEMFDDIAEKLLEGEDIPNYLSNGFKELITSDEALVAAFTDLLKD